MKTYRPIARFYDAEYADLPMLQEDTAFLIHALPRTVKSVLVLACGSGRSAIPLAESGRRVVGVDIDAGMIARAEQKRDAVGLSAKQLRFECQDVTKLKLSETFDAAVLMFNGLLMFTTLEQQDEVMEGICRHLRPRGTVWIDIFNPDTHRIAEAHEENADVRLFYVDSIGASVQRVTHVSATNTPQVRRTEFEYRWHEGGRMRRAKIDFEMTYLFPRELRMLVERHGLELEQMWGDYDGSAVSVESPRLIARARARPARGRVGALSRQSVRR
jgi:SAM-dependent methyltransferase